MTSMREQARSRDLTAPWVAWDAWRATHGRPAGIAARQAVRLEALVQRAHQASRFYAEHYRTVPPGPIDQAFYRIRVPRTEGGEAVLLPMAVATVVEETRGVRRYQVLQTATTVITIRLDHEPGTDRAEVWQRVRAGLGRPAACPWLRRSQLAPGD